MVSVQIYKNVMIIDVSSTHFKAGCRCGWEELPASLPAWTFSECRRWCWASVPLHSPHGYTLIFSGMTGDCRRCALHSAFEAPTAWAGASRGWWCNLRWHPLSLSKCRCFRPRRHGVCLPLPCRNWTRSRGDTALPSSPTGVRVRARRAWIPWVSSDSLWKGIRRSVQCTAVSRILQGRYARWRLSPHLSRILLAI